MRRAGLRLQGLLATLRTWPWRETAEVLAQRFREDRLGQSAGSLAFITTLALVPLVSVTLLLFRAWPAFGGIRRALEGEFLASLFPEGIAEPVLRTVMQFALKADRLGSVGVLVLVLTACSLLLTIDRTLNALWRVSRPRPLPQRVLVYWGLATLGPLLLGLSLSISTYVVSAGLGWAEALPGGVRLLLDLLQLVLLASAAAALYRCVPHTTVRWSDAWAGGVFVALGLQVAKALLGWYIETVPLTTRVYGAFATLPIFLIWLYMAWLIVLFGAVIAAYAPSLRMRVRGHAAGPGAAFELAVLLLRPLAEARRQGRHGLSLDTLAARLRVDPLQLEPLVEGLRRLDWVGRLEEEGPRLVLLVDPERTPAGPLLVQTLLGPGEAARALDRLGDLAGLSLASLLDPPR